MKSEPEDSAGRRGLSTHILSASVVMIGVATSCQSAYGSNPRHEFAGLAALLFLLSAGASCLSIRFADHAGFSQRCERIADQIFICGLVGISAMAVLFAYELI